MATKLGLDAKRAFNNHSGLGVYSRGVIEAVEKSISTENIVLFTPKKKIWNSSLTTAINPIGALWRSFFIYFDLKKYAIDVYHGLVGELPFLLPNKLKTVVTIHDLLFLKFPEDYPWIDRFIYNFKARYACKKANLIITISEVTKSDIISHYRIAPNKIKVIPVAAPTAPIAQTNRLHDKNYILCISSFLGRKNQALLLEAYLKIVDEVAYDLIFIGSGPEKKMVKMLAAASLHSHRIHFISDISDNEKFNYLHHCLFSVYPSKGEGFGIPILESFLANKAILLSDTPIHREVAGDAAYYFQNNSAMDLSDKLLYVHSANKAIHIEQGKLRLEKFAEEKSNYELTEIYFSLMGRAPRI